MRPLSQVFGPAGLAAIIAGSLVGQSSAPALRVQVQRPAIMSYEGGDATTAALRFDFGLLMTNVSRDPVSVPSSNARGAEITRAFVEGVEAKQADGTWKYIGTGSFYDGGDIRYDSCRSLSAGGSAEIPKVISEIPFPKTQLQQLGREPTVRLDLVLLCNDPKGTTVAKRAITDSFTPHLPDTR
jgi:hypothetical protein